MLKRISVEQAVLAIAIYGQIPLRFVDVELEDAAKVEGLELDLSVDEIVSDVQEGRRADE